MTLTVAARIFGPGLPPSGSNGNVTVVAAAVEVAVGSLRLSPSIDRLQFGETGFGTPGLALTWSDDGGSTPGRWSAHVTDPAQAEQLRDSPLLAGHTGLAALRARQQRVGRWRRLGWVVLAAFVALPLLLLVAFLANADRIAGWVTANIPIEQEIAFGQQAFANMKPDLKLVAASPQSAAVRVLGERLTRGSRYPFEFHVVEDETINAFAMPGGIVVVHTGLISATHRAEELAGVLAHEVQHVEQRHSLEGMVKQMGLYALWSLATGDLGGTLASRAALELTGLKFSRDAEEEADQKGFDALVAAGVDPSGMPAFFETMAAQGGDLPAGFLSTHPLSRDRQAAMTARLSGLGARDFAPLAMTPWPPPR